MPGRITNMITFSKADAPTFGRGTSTPVCNVADTGRININTEGSKVLAGCKYITLQFDPPSGQVLISGFATIPAKSDPRLYLTLSWPKETKGGTKESDKGRAASIAAGGFLGFILKKGHTGYDYTKSGGQSFAAESEAKNKTVSFILPKESMVAKPKVTRKRKPKGPELVAGVGQDVPAAAGTANVQSGDQQAEQEGEFQTKTA